MEFLKDIYGDKSLTYEDLVQAINAHNGNEANKENQIKLGNLGTGKYVDKGKHDNLQALLSGKENDLTAANQLIEQLKKGTKDSEALQNKVTEYEQALAASQQREQELKVKYALDVSFLAEGIKAENAELLAIALERKLKEKNETIELDENGHIKGWDDKLKGLKTQYPNMFETATAKRKVDPNRLPDGDGDTKTEPQSLEEALRMQYEGSGE